MAFSTATYGGVPIFGLVTRFVATLNPNARQVTAFPGVNGVLSKFLGTRGGTFEIGGVLYNTDMASVNIAEQILLSYADGAARTLTDVRGRSFANVVFDGEYTPAPDGPHPYANGWILAYSMRMHGLTT